ncbi:MAG: hypothetical protein IE889_04285 [Campylobacterales bacterium]|nr:hypothetical protein [Campylobacterales bacterium]
MKHLSTFVFILIAIGLQADEIDIHADHFYANDINKQAYFEGNAEVIQRANRFNADKIVVHFNQQRKAIKYEAMGSVKFDITENEIHYKGKAQTITYAPNDSKYYFSGDVVLEDLTNKRKIEAEEVSLDLKTGLADIKGNKERPVHFKFEIEDRK